MMKSEDVLIKALRILKRELTDEEFAIYLQQITKRSGDSVKELREKTKNLTMDELVKMIRKYQPL
jgi:N-methylhydantoinase A/oxoprolinase/acetone carboxylase beta subunit